jgi:hypothetical protein
MIGLRSGDIGDYSQPSERLYTQIFNQTGLQTLVYTRYIPRNSNQVLLNNDQTSNSSFYYRSGPFYGVKNNSISLIFTVFFFSLIGG